MTMPGSSPAKIILIGPNRKNRLRPQSQISPAETRLAAASAAAEMAIRYWPMAGAAVGFRLVLVLFGGDLHLASRPEVSTPLTSLRRRKRLPTPRSSSWSWPSCGFVAIWALVSPFSALQWRKATGWSKRPCHRTPVSYTTPVCHPSRVLTSTFASEVATNELAVVAVMICYAVDRVAQGVIPHQRRSSMGLLCL